MVVWANGRLCAKSRVGWGKCKSWGDYDRTKNFPHGKPFGVRQGKAMVRFVFEATASDQMEAGLERCDAETGRTSTKMVAVDTEGREGASGVFERRVQVPAAQQNVEE